MKSPERGEVCLRYTAATSDDSSFLLDQMLFKVSCLFCHLEVLPFAAYKIFCCSVTKCFACINISGSDWPIFQDMKGISFAAVEGGKPLHVPRVSNHGNIQFWNPQREEDDREGSFVVIPLKVCITVTLQLNSQVERHSVQLCVCLIVG